MSRAKSIPRVVDEYLVDSSPLFVSLSNKRFTGLFAETAEREEEETREDGNGNLFSPDEPRNIFSLW